MHQVVKPIECAVLLAGGEGRHFTDEPLNPVDQIVVCANLLLFYLLGAPLRVDVNYSKGVLARFEPLQFMAAGKSHRLAENPSALTPRLVVRSNLKLLHNLHACKL
jgi:hypothetical protein